MTDFALTTKNKACFYVTSEEKVREIISEGKTLLVNNQEITLRPMITPNKRIIISNIRPEIPNSIIEGEFKKVNVALKSEIIYLKAAAHEAIFAHIRSFRRQVYVSAEDVERLPSALRVSSNGTYNWIYISSDIITCFQCKKEGHIAKNCQEFLDNDNIPPMATGSQTNDNYDGAPLDMVQDDEENINPLDTVNNGNKSDFPTLRLPRSLRVKRPASPLSSSHTASSVNPNQKDVYTSDSSESSDDDRTKNKAPTPTESSCKPQKKKKKKVAEEKESQEEKAQEAFTQHINDWNKVEEIVQKKRKKNTRSISTRYKHYLNYLKEQVK